MFDFSFKKNQIYIFKAYLNFTQILNTTNVSYNQLDTNHAVM